MLFYIVMFLPSSSLCAVEMWKIIKARAGLHASSAAEQVNPRMESLEAINLSHFIINESDVSDKLLHAAQQHSPRLGVYTLIFGGLHLVASHALLL